MDCDICYYCVDINNLNICKCDFKTCLKCIKKIDKIFCIQCNEILQVEIIKKLNLDTNIYKKYFVLSRLNSYSEIIINKIITTFDNKKLLKFSTKNETAPLKFVFSCKQCTGYVNVDYVCKKCDSKHCNICEELLIENHKCNNKNINSLQEIKKNYKKCPFCLTYIEKSSGCNDMRCTCCGIYFNWSNLEINNSGNSNTNYTNVFKPELQSLYSEEKLDYYEILRKNYFPFMDFLLDRENKQFFKNILNKIQKYIKKIINFEYSYFIENKNITDDIIQKLYYLYKSIEYLNKILTNVYEYKLQNSSNSELIVKTKFFNNLIKSCEKEIYPDKIKYYFKNKYFNKQNSLHLLKIHSYTNNKKSYRINKSYNIYNILKKFKLCTHSIAFDSKEVILNILSCLNINNIVIISYALSIKSWKVSLEHYSFNVIFLPVNKLDLIVNRNNDIIEVNNSKFKIKEKFKNFIHNNSILIFDYDSYYIQKNVLSRRNINAIILFLIKYYINHDLYFINLCNNISEQLHFYNMIFNREIEQICIFLKLTKQEIMKLIKKRNIFSNTNHLYINNTYNYKYYKIDETDIYIIYRLNNIFYIYDKKEKVTVTQSHKICNAKKVCIYCKICSPFKTNNTIDHSICCHIHSLSFVDTKPKHKSYLDPNEPVLKSIYPNINYITKKIDIEIYKNKIIYLLEILGFSIYEIGLLYNSNKYFIYSIKQYLFQNTISNKVYANLNIYSINLSQEESKLLKYAYKNYDIVNDRVTYFKNVELKGSMVTEHVYLKHIYEYILSIYNQNKLHNQKIIILLEFNETIDELIRHLRNITNKILSITGKMSINQKYNVIKQFENSDNNIIIINISTNIDKLNLKKYYTHIIYLNMLIMNFYQKNNIFYTNKHKSIITKIN